MAWDEVEAEPEVDAWLLGLNKDDFGQAQFYIDLLEERGPLLGEPYTRQLRGKPRELRFSLGGERIRITYYLAIGRRIILLTAFRKSQRQARREIERAERVMERCIVEGHDAEED